LHSHSGFPPSGSRPAARGHVGRHCGI
jgi:hypothetical protein